MRDLLVLGFFPFALLPCDGAPEEISAVAAESAQEVGYAQLAPIFPPLSKDVARPSLGLPGLRAAADRGLPVLAQGGIDISNVRAVCAAGAAGVAVTGAILMADDPAAATAALRGALDA